MLTPPVLVRRRPIALVTMIGSVAFTAGLAASVLVERKTVEPPRKPMLRGCTFENSGPSLTAQLSRQQIDVMSPNAFAADGVLDEVIEIELTTKLAVRHIFVTGSGGARQWDTVVGGEPIPFGRVYGGRRGVDTWDLGVRENGAWRKNPTTPGSYQLELIGDGVEDGPDPRTVTVMFVDGSTITAAVSAR